MEEKNRPNFYFVPRQVKAGIQFGKFTIADLITIACSFIVAVILMVSFGGIGQYLIPKLIGALIILLGGFALTVGGDGTPKARTSVFNMFKFLFRRKKYPLFRLKQDLNIDIIDDCIINIKQNNEYALCIEVESTLFLMKDEYEKGQIVQTLKSLYASVDKIALYKLDMPIKIDAYARQIKRKLDEVHIELSTATSKLEIKQCLAREHYLNLEYNNLSSYLEDNRTTQRFFIFIYDSKMENLGEKANDIINILKLSKLDGKIANKALIEEVFINFFDSMPLLNDEISINKWQEYSTCLRFFFGKDINDKPIFYNYKVFAITGYPRQVGDAYLANLMFLNGVKMCSKIKRATDISKLRAGINRSIVELQTRMKGKVMEDEELQYQIDVLTNLATSLNAETEQVHDQKIYFLVPIPMVKDFLALCKGNYLKVDKMLFRQGLAYQEMLPIRFMPKKELKSTYVSLPSSLVSAQYPFIFPTFMDKHGDFIGESFNIPVFFDSFSHINDKVDNRVNGNIVITGASGVGKSYLSKLLLLNAMTQAKKVRILDPENEYHNFCTNFNGIYVNTAGGDKIINPLQIFTSLSDDEDTDKMPVTNHKQFLESFFKSLFKKLDEDDLLFSYLNIAIDKLYLDYNIDDNSPLSPNPKDYPILQDLYKTIIHLKEISEDKGDIQANNNYRTLELLFRNYVNTEDGKPNGKAKLWNNHTTLRLDNSLIVFNFQQMLAGFTKEDSSAQMILVMQFLNQEIIANRDENAKNGTNNKITLLIDEAHNFVKKERPECLTFMLRMAKQIRKYNGNIIVTTQQINDFLGGDADTRKKAEGIITNCQYSFIGGNPNAVDSLVSLYGNIYPFSEEELQIIRNSERGKFLFQRDSHTRTIINIMAIRGSQEFFEGTNIYNQINEEVPDDDLNRYLEEVKLNKISYNARQEGVNF